MASPKDRVEQWKKDGYVKAKQDTLKWNDDVNIVTKKLEVMSGKVCKIHDEYILIKNTTFQRVYNTNVLKIYCKPYVKPKPIEYAFDSDSD